MEDLKAVELKSFIPAKNFDNPKRFYQKVGFELISEFDDIAYFKINDCAFLLQNYSSEEYSNNVMMHLLVEDIHSWYQHIMDLGLISEFPIRVTDLVEQP